ncbi:MAG: HAMP domain-containing sensor histidine kinase [Sulfitobacter litoralis]|uniref:histidine kinase n=1 Tax=Sulfitobacter litoralis TaxID=335975 RepID=A0ABY0SRR4_9RHOB|nr:HAMP domain-containing sensor histidine kinase [Sulfitobacter litoralis]MBQ0716830.1 HAMP domain-containing histidine kinase [Sulfitobacter litoralis]SDP54687.1 histidine kinase [Sulfitobacter litoralis]
MQAIDNVNLPQTRPVLSRLRDYALVGSRAFAQRAIIYTVAIGLAGYYYDLYVALFFFAAIGICEVYDILVLRSILRNTRSKTLKIRKSLFHIYMTTALSATTISLFCIAIAIQQGVGNSHFLPLFLLISASIFAAMNNHQFLYVLGFRLAIYIGAILYIPIRDVVIARPSLDSEIWLNLFTALFVLGFVLELARTFIKGYSALMKNRLALQIEAKNALAASEAKTRFLSTVSHELRTPLTSIRGALDLINAGSAGEVPDKMSRLLDIATRNAHRLGELVGDLLLLQSADVGKFSLDLGNVDLAEVVNTAAHSFQPYASRFGVAVKIDVKTENPIVRGDRKRLDQVVVNLLSNAAKFSQAGGTISVGLGRDGENLVISVADQGIGIPEGSESVIFEEFGQLDSSDQRKFQGTGLGLSISKRIVDAHSGSIAYTSKLGYGTTFNVSLKAADAADGTKPQSYSDAA